SWDRSRSCAPPCPPAPTWQSRWSWRSCTGAGCGWGGWPMPWPNSPGLGAGRVQASYEPVNLAAVTADLAGLFRGAAERAGLAYQLDCPPLPEPVCVDREMWAKVVLNLLS